MIAILSLLLVLCISILVNRIATVALTHTGLSRESARFQARSAFSGVGYTTQEAESVVNHPVRRRILMLLMLLGNAGIVAAASSMILAFVQTARSDRLWLRIALLVAGILLLWALANSRWVDRHLSNVVTWMLKRFTDLDVRDYAGLLQIGGDYQVVEMLVEGTDWLANKTLRDAKLRREGVIVLGVMRKDATYLGVPQPATAKAPGDVLLRYGRNASLEALDQRRAGIGGELAHTDAVAEQERVLREETEAGQPSDKVQEAE